LEAPEISEEEIRKQITEEFELREKQKIAQLEEEIKRAEQEKQEEIRGKKIQEPY
jgi:dynein intermediate chain